MCSNVCKHFKIVARARSKRQLDVLEAIYTSRKKDSALTRHLKSSPKCLYSVCSNVCKHFKIVARARSKRQLDVLEAIYTSRKYACLSYAFKRNISESCICFEVTFLLGNVFGTVITYT